MAVIDSGAERCALPPGIYTVGGKGRDALALTSLEWCSAVATIVVEPDGAATVQRLTASVVVRLDRVPLGIGPKELHDGSQIEFTGVRLTFWNDGIGEAGVSTAPMSGHSDEWRTAVDYAAARTPADEESPAAARLVNVRTGASIALGKQRIVVGRDESCDFVVPGMGVSRRHFSVAPVHGGYLLRDESANGTLVNGKPVCGSYLLGHDDILCLDQEELRFELAGAVAPVSTAESRPTQILDVARLREESAGARREPAQTAFAASLEIVRGPFAGASFNIDRPVASIGRGAQCDVRIRDDSVSTTHATLLHKGGSWFVVDLRSANGTFVDGSRVAGERELASGSRLKLGSVELRF
ncbi:MAG TPA: FHA domain-containing protein, partial [Gemmatimonadaceae bacterium]|nr:FHA domain-containing protein [Gemmatimonadaceae bacterium]